MLKEILGEAFPIIEKAAPYIASTLVGPLAGSAISLIETVFDGSIKNPQDLINKIITDPNKTDKLCKCNAIFSIGNGNLVALWESLGKPTKLNIEWAQPIN